MTEKDKKDDWIPSLVDFAMIKGESVGIPTFVFLKQQIGKIKRECTIVEAFLENHIKELRLKNDALDAGRKEEKEEEELNWKDGPHWHPNVKPKKK